MITYNYSGPTEFFSGAGGSVINRKVKVLRVLSATVFTTLTMQFPAAPAGGSAVAPTAVTYPAGYDLWDVATFRLASGSVQAIYNY